MNRKPISSDLVNTNLDKKELYEFLVRCYESIILLSDLLFPHYKTDGNGRNTPSPPFHYELDSLLRGAISKQTPYNLLAILPRGTGKSTIIGLFFLVWAMLFSNKRFIVMVGESKDSIKEHFQTLVHELKNNPTLKLLGIEVDYSGPVQEMAINVKTPAFDKDLLALGETEKIVKIRAYGIDTLPRGLKIGNSRPDLLLIDDLERQKSGHKSGVESAEYRAEIKKAFYAKITKLGFNAETLQIIMLGTIMHNDQLLVDLLKNAEDPDARPRFKAIRMSMIQDFGLPTAKSIWPEKMTLAQFEQELATAKKNGTESIIYNELLSLPYAPNDTAISPNDFRYFKRAGGMLMKIDGELVDPTEEPIKLSQGSIVVAVDLAFTTKMTADYTAIAVGFTDGRDNLFILDILYGRWTPEEISKQLDSVLVKYKPDAIGVEKNRGGEPMIWILERELANNKNFRGIVRLADKGMKKEDRILNKLLIPYKAGRVFHLHGASYLSEYEDEVRGITKHGIKSKHDDLVDAVSYLTEMSVSFNVYRGEDEDYKPSNNKQFKSPYVF